MADREYTASQIVRDGMEVLRFRCEPRDWQRQLAHVDEQMRRQRSRQHRGIVGVLAGSIGITTLVALANPYVALFGALGALIPTTAVMAATRARKTWFPNDSVTDPPEVLFTATGVLIDDDIARPWRGAGYRLIDAHVSDDVSPWIELTFRGRWRVEIYQLPVPDGLLKAAMEITEMLRAKCARRDTTVSLSPLTRGNTIDRPRHRSVDAPAGR